MFLIFDTETTGILETGKEIPNIVQIAYVILDKEYNLIKKQDFIIKPEDFIIPEESIKVHHITNEIANKQGVLLREALIEFTEDIKRSKYLIAHNINYDFTVVKEALKKSRLKIEPLLKIKQIDTMRTTTNLVNTAGKNGRKKAPRLEELHMYLFNKDFGNKHNAFGDVMATKDCFIHLCKNKHYDYILK